MWAGFEGTRRNQVEPLSTGDGGGAEEQQEQSRAERGGQPHRRALGRAGPGRRRGHCLSQTAPVTISPTLSSITRETTPTTGQGTPSPPSPSPARTLRACRDLWLGGFPAQERRAGRRRFTCWENGLLLSPAPAQSSLTQFKHFVQRLVENLEEIKEEQERRAFRDLAPAPCLSLV